MSWLLLLLAQPAEACGPFFPQVLIVGTSDEDLFDPPRADLDHELARVLPPSTGGYSAVDTLAADVADLAAVLGSHHPAVSQLISWRAALDEGRAEPLPKELPTEFRLYLEGVASWTAGDSKAAARSWRKVLALPKAQRRYRGAWAAWMLRDWERTRAEASAGVDTHGLRVAAWGAEAADHYNAGEYAAALPLYLEQWSAGDPSARTSIRWTVEGLLEDPAQTSLAAKEPRSAAAVTAVLLASGASRQAGSWLEAVEAAGGEPLGGADRMAWLAYDAGDFDAAGRWLDQAEPGPLGAWIQARLLMREGKVEEARAVLADIAFPEEERWTTVWWARDISPSFWGEPMVPVREVAAESAVLALHEGDYAAALQGFLDAGRWLEAAWVAERVLSPDELVALLPELEAGELEGQLEALSARRLAREGRWEEATPLYEEALRPYAQALVAGRDAGDSEGLWQAALTLRYLGMELTGTELDPDFAYTGGYYQLWFEEGRAEASGLLAMSADEAARVEASQARPEQRYHYRYLAAELGAEAAGRTRDNALATSMLCVAGSWLKVQDPEAANVYYKAMVRRGKRTELGKHADAMRWFPRDCQLPAELRWGA